MSVPTVSTPVAYSQISAQKAEQARSMLWTAIILLSGFVVAIFYILFLFLQTGTWQYLAVVAVDMASSAALIISIVLTRRGRLGLSLGFYLLAVNLAIILDTLLVAGIGLLIGFVGVLLTVMIVPLILPPKTTNWVIVASVMVGAFAGLLDLLDPATQLVAPLIETFLPILFILMFLIYGVLIAWQFKRYALSTKLVVTFLAIVLIPLGLLSLMNGLTTQRAVTEAANQKLAAAAAETAARIESFIEANLGAVSSEALLPEFVEFLSSTDQQPANDRVLAILTSLNGKDLKHITSYALLNGEGLNIADSNRLAIGLSEAERDYFQIPSATGEVYVSPVLFSKQTGEPELYFSAPVRDPEERILGVLRVRYHADILQDLVAQSTRLAGENAFAVLFDENHLHLAHGDENFAPEANFKLVALPSDSAELRALQAAGRLPDLPREQLSTNLPQLDQGLADAATQPFFTATDVATGEKVNQVAVKILEGENMPPWLVAFFQPREVFLTPVQQQTRLVIGAAIGIAGLLAIAAIGLAQLLAGPIVRLTQVAQAVAGGDLDVQAQVETGDEIGLLAQAFNDMTAQLHNLIDSLEDQVQERTAELVLSMEVGQQAVAIRELDELLPTITEFIRAQFNLYYAQVYFIDDVGLNLVLRAGTGDVGEQLLSQDHSLPLGAGSIVGRAAAEKRPVVVSDTETSDVHKPNLLLPDTRSELAVPLMVEGRVIGVLDMQADQANTFTEQNLTVFEAMATQLAISIDSAQQWTNAQAAQRRAEEALRRLTREAWAERLASMEEGLGFAYDLSAVTALEVKVEDASRGGAEPQNGGLAVPVVVQNEPIGQLSVETPAGKKWHEDEQTLLRAVAQQLAQKAENLRLFEQTQQRAAREHMARQITDKVRASRNIESALKTAAEELSKALGTARAVVDLNVTPPSAEASDPTLGPEEEQNGAEDTEK